MEHRAITALRDMETAFPNIWNAVNMVREKPSDRISGWDETCFVPSNVAWVAIALSKGVSSSEEFMNLPEKIDLSMGGGMGLAALSAWRMTKGIYRIDSNLYDSLLSTSVGEEVPTEVFDTLPEWCIYIETPKLKANGIDIYGAWCCKIHDVESEGSEGSRVLLILLHTDKELIPIMLDLSSDSLAEGIELTHKKAEKINANLGYGFDSEGSKSLSDAVLSPILSLLIYICTQSDISNKGSYDKLPSNPKPKKVKKKGYRLFPASGITNWDVGIRMGAALNAYKDDYVPSGDEAQGSKKRPHIRRAHWHTYLLGKRLDCYGNPVDKSKRKKKVKWIPPVSVNLDEDVELPAVVRRVLKN